MDCPYCGAEMSSLGVNQLQLGRASVLGGIWGNIAAGSLETEVFLCRSCGKLEFYELRPKEFQQPERLQLHCTRRGQPHDYDDAKCPFCGERLL